MRDDKDRGSKWLLQHHGDAVLRLAGITGFRDWRAAQAEVVQPKKVPDGLLEVFFEQETTPTPVLLALTEIMTRLAYNDRRLTSLLRASIQDDFGCDWGTDLKIVGST